MRPSMLRGPAVVLCTIAIGAARYRPSESAAARCEALAAIRLSNVVINVATPVTGGSFTPAGAQQRAHWLTRSRRWTGSFAYLWFPGYLHCRGGPGPNEFDAQAAIEAWVEHGVAPETIVATHATNGKVDRSRPLCPYPKVAVYSGTGDFNDAANFTCRER